MNNVNMTMDGRELFLQLADKVMRGEIVITHFVMNLMPEINRRYDIGMRGEVFLAESPRTKFEAKVSAVQSDGTGREPPVQVSIPAQVRELIFDEPATPIYDEDLK